MNKANATNIAKIKIDAIEFYLPPYTPPIPQKSTISKHNTIKTPTELEYEERSVSMIEVNCQKFWTFELGTQEGINIPVWIIIEFQQKERQNSQNLINGTFHRPLVTNTQCIIGKENYPDSAFLLNYGDDEYSQGYGQITVVFRAQRKTISSNRFYLVMLLDHLIIVKI